MYSSQEYRSVAIPVTGFSLPSAFSHFITSVYLPMLPQHLSICSTSHIDITSVQLNGTLSISVWWNYDYTDRHMYLQVEVIDGVRLRSNNNLLYYLISIVVNLVPLLHFPIEVRRMRLGSRYSIFPRYYFSSSMRPYLQQAEQWQMHASDLLLIGRTSHRPMETIRSDPVNR